MASVTFDITYMPTIVDKLGLSVECPIVAASRLSSGSRALGPVCKHRSGLPFGFKRTLPVRSSCQ